MKNPALKFVLASLTALTTVLASRADTITDNFSSSVDYLTNGVVGTVWDGLYLGGREYPNTGLGAGGAVPGVTLVCDANLSTNGLLTVRSANTDWGDGPHDDGFLLFKVVPGDFSASVQLITPYDNGNFNTAGLLVRAFGIGGS